MLVCFASAVKNLQCSCLGKLIIGTTSGPCPLQNPRGRSQPRTGCWCRVKSTSKEISDWDFATSVIRLWPWSQNIHLHLSQKWSLRYASRAGSFLKAYFAAYWGIVCPGRTIKSLFYLIRKLLRHMNYRSVFQYISHWLIFQFYETSRSYLWVRFSEPVLDFK